MRYKIAENKPKISVSGQICGQRREMGLFNPRSREEQARYVCCENARFQEIMRGNKRKTRVRYEPSFWSECKERSDEIASLRASKTSRSAERGRRRQNLRCPPPSHSRCASVDRLPPSTPCFRRFRCGKNSYQLFLPCYPTTPSMPSMTALGLTE